MGPVLERFIQCLTRGLQRSHGTSWEVHKRLEPFSRGFEEGSSRLQKVLRFTEGKRAYGGFTRGLCKQTS